VSWTEAITTIRKGNRVTLPKELREALNLQPPMLLTLKIGAINRKWESIEFHAHLRADGQITIPIELYRELDLQLKQVVLLHVHHVKRN